MCVCVCVCACVRACVRACVCACMLARARARVYVSVRLCACVSARAITRTRLVTVSARPRAHRLARARVTHVRTYASGFEGRTLGSLAFASEAG